MQAVKVADYIVCYAHEHSNPISNLQLQKILYFLWIEFYKESKTIIFDDKFEAWHFGPVIPSVYYKFCSFGGMKITPNTISLNKPNLDVSDNQKTFIDKFIEKYAKFSAYELVQKSHKEGSAWSLIYSNGAGNKKEIPNEKIVELECCV